MVLNLESRLAQRVLVEVAEGPYRDEQALYDLAGSVETQVLPSLPRSSAGKMSRSRLLPPPRPRTPPIDPVWSGGCPG